MDKRQVMGTEMTDRSATAGGPQTRSPGWIVCFGGEDWWYHSHGHFDIQVMKRLAKTTKVLYVCSIGMRMPSLRRDRLFLRRVLNKVRSAMHALRRVHPNLYVCSLIPFPFYGSSLSRALNKVATLAQLKSVFRRLRIESPLFWINTPTAWLFVPRLRRGGLVYQRTDDYAAYDFENFNSDYIRRVDRSLITEADLVIHVSEQLHRDALRFTANSMLVTQGVDERFFCDPGDSAADLERLRRPLVGYVGGMDRYKFDADLVESVAIRMPACTFVLIGTRNPNAERLQELPNVHFLGMKDHGSIPAYVHALDVCIVPTAHTEWGLKCRPLKLMEYLAAGKPVVASETPASLEFRNAVTIARNTDEWVAGIEAAVQSSTTQLSVRQQSPAKLNSWESLVEQFLGELESRGLVERGSTAAFRGVT